MALVGLLGGPWPGDAGSTAVPADVSPVALAQMATGGLKNPLFRMHAVDGSFRFYVLEQPGRIRLLGAGGVVGEYVYRGRKLPALRGRYVSGDFCSGEVFAFRKSDEGGGGTSPTVLLKTGFRISSFGQDEEGELYAVDHGGGIYRFVPPR